MRAQLGRGVDLALEFVGRPETVEMTLRCLDTGGRAVLVGVGPGRPSLPPLVSFIVREQSVIGSFGMDKRDIADLFDLVARGRLDLSRSVTQTYALEEINEALGRLARKDTGIVRLVVEPGR
ncbi:MAG TPA: zinc-binding dehydrogenase [Burkholderiaceae bacterium]|nr:zinc-binding dehydrogenase [Burkholderiaceae bacterium]